MRNTYIPKFCKDETKTCHACVAIFRHSDRDCHRLHSRPCVHNPYRDSTKPTSATTWISPPCTAVIHLALSSRPGQGGKSTRHSLASATANSLYLSITHGHTAGINGLCRKIDLKHNVQMSNRSTSTRHRNVQGNVSRSSRSTTAVSTRHVIASAHMARSSTARVLKPCRIASLVGTQTSFKLV